MRERERQNIQDLRGSATANSAGATPVHNESMEKNLKVSLYKHIVFFTKEYDVLTLKIWLRALNMCSMHGPDQRDTILTIFTEVGLDQLAHGPDQFSRNLRNCWRSWPFSKRSRPKVLKLQKLVFATPTHSTCTLLFKSLFHLLPGVFFLWSPTCEFSGLKYDFLNVLVCLFRWDYFKYEICI